MRMLFLVVIAAIGLTYAMHVGAPLDFLRLGKPLDKTVWEVKVRADRIFAFSHKDTLIFEDGRLTVGSYADKGFLPAKYGAEAGDMGGAAAWQASLKQDGAGTSQWQGVAQGEGIEGTVLWIGKNGKTKRYTFKGSKKTD